MSELLFPIVESLCLELQLKKAADPDQHAHEMMDAQANKRMPSSSKEEALPIVKRRKIAREGSQPEFQATVENEGRQPRLPTTAEKESSPDTAQQFQASSAQIVEELWDRGALIVDAEEVAKYHRAVDAP